MSKNANLILQCRKFEAWLGYNAQMFIVVNITMVNIIMKRMILQIES